ncbi:MAG TPA: hypothetical protein DCP02_04595, partial [Actinobacteria bacterium]|nr:hypothetical protein [Actinomycetota bacterium]
MKGNAVKNKSILLKSHNGPLRSIIIRAAIAAFIAVLFLFPTPLEAITLKELGNAIASLDQEQEKLIEEIVASETTVEIRKNEIAAINEELQLLKTQLEELNRQKEETAKSIESKKALLAGKMIFTYKYGNDDVAKFIISANNLNEVVNNLFLFKNIMSREAELIQSLRFEREKFDRISRKSEEKVIENEILKAQLKEEKEKLEKDLAENRVLLDKL